MSRTKEEVLKEIEELTKLKLETRDPVEKAEYAGKIELAKDEIRKMDDVVMEKHFVPSRDVSAVADHKSGSVRGSVRGPVTVVSI